MFRGYFRSFLLVAIALPGSSYAAQQLIPAGSLVRCTISDPKLSSKTAEVGDPVLCQISHVNLAGRSVLPYDSYLVGQFKAYKDPGHLVGKGWMELEFDRIVIEPDMNIPIDARVVDVPGYIVDKQGRIMGKGHAVRDTVTWMIPILWPIDLINLPRRGPRPVLKQETRLTLKIMDDISVPIFQTSQPDADGLSRRSSMTYSEPQTYAPPMAYTPPMVNAPPRRQLITAIQPPPSPQPVMQPASQVLTVLAMRDGYTALATDYWFENGSQIHYVDANGASYVLPIEQLDLTKTVEINRHRGVDFVIRLNGYGY